ncbi:MAG: hypothetical protein Q9164_000691 [Protoblastenia rupestris]
MAYVSGALAKLPNVTDVTPSNYQSLTTPSSKSSHFLETTISTKLAETYGGPQHPTNTSNPPIPVPSTNYVVTVDESSPYPDQSFLPVDEIIHCLSLLEVRLATDTRGKMRYPEVESCAELEVSVTPASLHKKVSYENLGRALKALRGYIAAVQLKGGQRWKLRDRADRIIAWGAIYDYVDASGQMRNATRIEHAGVVETS